MTDLTPWNNPKSYLPNLEDQLGIVEHYEKLARQAKRSGRFGFANRATREPSRVSPSRPSGRMSAIARAISGDCFYLISGAMVALDLVLVIWLVRR